MVPDTPSPDPETPADRQPSSSAPPGSAGSAGSPASEAVKPLSAPGVVDFLTMGLSSALCLVVGGGIGYAIDDAARSSPLWTLVGLGFGLVTAVMLLVAKVRKYL